MNINTLGELIGGKYPDIFIIDFDSLSESDKETVNMVYRLQEKAESVEGGGRFRVYYNNGAFLVTEFRLDDVSILNKIKNQFPGSGAHQMIDDQWEIEVPVREDNFDSICERLKLATQELWDKSGVLVM